MMTTTTTATATRTAVFMMGGPASGKSTVRASLFSGMTAIDCDEIKAEHQEYDEKNPSAVHEWSSQEATRRFYAAIGTGQDVVYDGTGSTAEKYVAFMNAARLAGYRTLVVLVTADVAQAVERNMARGRSIPESVLREKHSLVATSFTMVSPFADEVRIVRN